MTQPAGDQLSLATLATRVSELAGQLGELTDLPGETARLAGELARISGMLASRPAGSQEHADQDDSEKDRWEKRKQGEEHPRNWAMLSDDASAKALRDLGRWVTSILFVSYPHW